jgi:hypothetical protein
MADCVQQLGLHPTLVEGTGLSPQQVLAACAAASHEAQPSAAKSLAALRRLASQALSDVSQPSPQLVPTLHVELNTDAVQARY